MLLPHSTLWRLKWVEVWLNLTKHVRWVFVGNSGPVHWLIKTSPGIWKQVCWFLVYVQEMYGLHSPFSKLSFSIWPVLQHLSFLKHQQYWHSLHTERTEYARAYILCLTPTLPSLQSPSSTTAFNKFHFITNFLSWPRKSFKKFRLILILGWSIPTSALKTII